MKKVISILYIFSMLIVLNAQPVDVLSDVGVLADTSTENWRKSVEKREFKLGESGFNVNVDNLWTTGVSVDMKTNSMDSVNLRVGYEGNFFTLNNISNNKNLLENLADNRNIYAQIHYKF